MTSSLLNQQKIKDLSANSSYGMATIIWGPLFWALMNDISKIYDLYWSQWPNHIQIQMNQFWIILKNILPCKYCRESYTQFHQQDPPKFPFKIWVAELHNKVNHKLNKPPFEIKSFLRRSQIYTSFSSATTITDINFILALNYCPKTKKKYYQKWFEFLPLVMPYLIQHQMYHDHEVKGYMKISSASLNRNLKSKITLLHWLASCQPSPQKVPFYIMKYSAAIAHDTPEELSLICGNLLTLCKNKSLSRSVTCKTISKQRPKSRLRSKNKIRSN